MDGPAAARRAVDIDARRIIRAANHGTFLYAAEEPRPYWEERLRLRRLQLVGKVLKAPPGPVRHARRTEPGKPRPAEEDPHDPDD